MKACLDVGYDQSRALCACVLFKDWLDDVPHDIILKHCENVQPYISGEFYKRELPCLLAALNAVSVALDTILVDGYVWLDEQHSNGLGAHLFYALGAGVPVIGVAKTKFKTAPANEVLRNSIRPLYVSATGMSHETASANIQKMHGKYRIPTLLKQVDELSRKL